MATPKSNPIGKTGGASHASAVTPSNSTNFTFNASALWIGTGGTVAVVLGDDSVVSFVAQNGSVIPVECKRVNLTGTTASDIVALYE